MAALASGQYLPPELIQEVLGHLNQPDLSKTSLVSKAWYKLTFPYLHQDKTVDGLLSLEKLTQRLETNPGLIDYVPCISLCLHSLSIIFDNKTRPRPDHAYKLEVLHRFRSIIPKLKRLKYLKWEEPRYFNAPVVIDILQDFRNECPELSGLTVNCYTYHPSNPIIVNYMHKAFEFSNMKYLDITYYEFGHNLTTARARAAPPEALIHMLESSPNLSQLSLSNKTCEALWNIKSPLDSLHHLRLKSCATLTSEDFSPLDRFINFFMQHSHITDLELDWVNGFSPTVTPTSIRTLFPALKRFTGRGELCKQVVASPLAAQLEYLFVKDEYGDISSYKQSLQELAQAVQSRSLPKLKELYFLCRDTTMCGTLDTDSLDLLLAATPELVSLEISYLSLELADLLGALMHVPQLTKLGARIIYTHEQEFDDAEIGVFANEIIFQTRKICVWLSRFRFLLINETHRHQGCRPIRIRRGPNVDEFGIHVISNESSRFADIDINYAFVRDAYAAQIQNYPQNWW